MFYKLRCHGYLMGEERIGKHHNIVQAGILRERYLAPHRFHAYEWGSQAILPALGL